MATADLARERALAALHEITTTFSVGDFVERTDNEDGSYNLIYACKLKGYPGWSWVVTLAEVDGDGPSVLEAELLPGEGALLAPDWVPWSVRLAEYKEAQAKALAEGLITEEEIAEAEAEFIGEEDELDVEDFDDDEVENEYDEQVDLDAEESDDDEDAADDDADDFGERERDDD